MSPKMVVTYVSPVLYRRIYKVSTNARNTEYLCKLDVNLYGYILHVHITVENIKKIRLHSQRTRKPRSGLRMLRQDVDNNVRERISTTIKDFFKYPYESVFF